MMSTYREQTPGSLEEENAKVTAQHPLQRPLPIGGSKTNGTDGNSGARVTGFLHFPVNLSVNGGKVLAGEGRRRKRIFRPFQGEFAQINRVTAAAPGPWLRDAEKDAPSHICSHHHLWSIWTQRSAASPHHPRVRNAWQSGAAGRYPTPPLRPGGWQRLV